MSWGCVCVCVRGITLSAHPGSQGCSSIWSYPKDGQDTWDHMWGFTQTHSHLPPKKYAPHQK